MYRDDTNIFHIYVDESSKSDTYFAVGAILLQKGSAREVSAFINETALAHKYRSGKEIHWSAMERPALCKELGTSLIGFTQKKPRKMRYRALVVESRHINRDRSSGETIEDIIAKFVFTLVFEMAKDVGTNVKYYVYYDSPDGQERQDVSTLCALNNRCKTKFKVATGPFKGFEFLRSENSRLIQAADLITGAVAYEMNGRHNAPGANAEKRDVFNAMLAAANLKTFTSPTKHYPPQFQILHFDFSKTKFTHFKPQRPKQLDLLD